MKRLFLNSSSVVHGQGFLDHCADALKTFLSSTNRVLFIPYALATWDGYAMRVRERFAQMDIELTSIHTSVSPIKAINRADALFIGGGNTFRLLAALQEKGLMSTIGKMVKDGMPYIGSSAGTNVACPTIKTTNDMPITEPTSFRALGLVPFQINPHFVDADSQSTHMGETREERIAEFLEENTLPVIGLREGSWIEVLGEKVYLRGMSGAKVFLPGKKPVEYTFRARLDTILVKS